MPGLTLNPFDPNYKLENWYDPETSYYVQTQIQAQGGPTGGGPIKDQFTQALYEQGKNLGKTKEEVDRDVEKYYQTSNKPITGELGGTVRTGGTGGIGGTKEPGNKPTTGGFRGLGGTGGNEGTEEDINKRHAKETPGYQPYQIETPDWLKTMSQEGYGKEMQRSGMILGGVPISEEANKTSRQIAGMPQMAGFSGSGFIIDQVKQLQLNKDKALEKLRLGIEGQNDYQKSQALDQLKSIEFMNKRMKEEWQNMTESERIAAQQRAWQIEQASARMKAENPPWYEQLAGYGLQYGPTILALAFG